MVRQSWDNGVLLVEVDSRNYCPEETMTTSKQSIIRYSRRTLQRNSQLFHSIFGYPGTSAR